MQFWAIAIATGYRDGGVGIILGGVSERGEKEDSSCQRSPGGVSSRRSLGGVSLGGVSERGEREDSSDRARSTLGRRKEEGGVSRRSAEIRREEREEANSFGGEGNNKIRYRTEIFTEFSSGTG